MASAQWQSYFYQTFLPNGAKAPDRNYKYRKLNEEELHTLLKQLPRKPLMAGKEGLRLSLAGAQKNT